nr:unnamed protein product [Callosobruchus chinensis]
MEFFERFRLTKRTCLILLDYIKDNLQPRTNRGGSVNAKCQLLLTLRFYATGSMLRSAGDFAGVSIASACRIVRRVSESIAALQTTYIKMPNRNETRKYFFGINVQTVSDSSLRIRDIVARWPGSTHDETIFNNSNLKRRFEAGYFRNYLLVEDAGYHLRPYLMTKLQNINTPAENLYNESIIRTRNVVEGQYGVWKRRFPVLKLGMRLNVNTIMAVIVATAVLHNMAIEENEDIPADWMANSSHEDDEVSNQNVGTQENQSGQFVRELLINEHFSNL